MTGAIFGILGHAPHDALDRMAARLSHRGPRRAIRQLADAAWIGAVSDHPERMLSTAPDAAVAAHATLYTGPDATRALADALASAPAAVERLDADFAAVRIEPARGRISFARDFFGSRPLYAATLPDASIAFASEYKALLALPSVSAEPDLDMVQHLQHAKRLPPGRTLLRSVWSPPPGCVLTLDASGATVSEHRFAPIEPTGTVTDPDAASALIRANLEAAALRRTRDDDPIALALSGGIDSIALAFLFRRLHPARRLVTVTAGSHDRDHEVVTARKVAAAVGSEHHEVITPPSMLAERLPAVVWHAEDPYSRSEVFQLHELARAAAHAGVRVLHHAQGADGLFAGMPKFALLALMQRHPLARGALQDFYAYTQQGLPPPHPLARLAAWAKFRGSVPPVPTVLGAAPPDRMTFPDPGPQFINRATSRAFQTGVCQDVQKFERTFAAFAVEARSVHYDLASVRAAFTIDDALKIRDGQQKWIFRRALEPWVPAEFRSIPKFPQRMEANLELASALDALADDLLSPGSVEARALFEPASIRALRRRNPSKPYSHEGGMRLWTAIMTELWARAFLDARGHPPGDPTDG